jgi:mannosyltransferase OCH1-like enzyme
VSVMPYTLLLDVPPRAVSELKFAHLPKKIFQTWRSTEVSEAMHQAVYSFIEQNPDWHYQLFTDAMQREFIQKHFSPERHMTRVFLAPLKQICGAIVCCT